MKANTAVIVGRVLTGLIAAMFLMGVVMSFSGNPQVTEGMVKYGFPAGFHLVVGSLELLCLIFFLIPQTTVLGAILLTGYLGGAVATHLRAGEPWFFPVIFGVVVWAAVYLRDPRLRSLIPLRK